MSDQSDLNRLVKSLEQRVRDFTHDSTEQLNVDTYFTEDAKTVLRFFYDERYKVRREQVPKFELYAEFCRRLRDHHWFEKMRDVDTAIDGLIKLGYLVERKSVSDGFLEMKVGEAAKRFELTATGLEILQGWHPPITLRLKAWIAVFPPWLVLVGSVAGAIGAIWKLIDFLLFALKGIL